RWSISACSSAAAGWWRRNCSSALRDDAGRRPDRRTGRTTRTMTRRPRTSTLALLAILALALAACSSKVVRAPGTGGPPAVSTPKPGATGVVRRGDTLYRLAVNNGISPMDLALWNGISAPYTIYPGQRLRLYPRSGGSAPATASRPPGGGTQRPVVRPTQ